MDLYGRLVLKTLELDPLTLLESARAIKEIKEIEFPCISPSPDTPGNEEKIDLDDDVPIADKLSETELDTVLNEMIAHAAKGIEKDHTEELLSLVFRFKYIWRVAPTNDGSATVKPLKVHLIPEVAPWGEKMRRYVSALLNFMYFQFTKLEKLGYVTSNPGIDGVPQSLSCRHRNLAMNSECLCTHGIPSLKLSQLTEPCRSWTLSCSIRGSYIACKSRRFQRILGLPSRCQQARDLFTAVTFKHIYFNKTGPGINRRSTCFRITDFRSFRKIVYQ